MRPTQCVVQVGMRIYKKKKNGKCAILRLILNILNFFIVATSFFTNRAHYQIPPKFCKRRPEL